MELPSSRSHHHDYLGATSRLRSRALQSALLLPQVAGALLNCVPPSLCGTNCLWGLALSLCDTGAVGLDKCSFVGSLFFIITAVLGDWSMLMHIAAVKFLFRYVELCLPSLKETDTGGFWHLMLRATPPSVLGCVHWIYLRNKMLFELRTDC